MKLTTENYYSQEAGMEYMSVSQYHDFVGTDAYPACEAKALAKVRGEWKEKPNRAMLIGSYVDSYFEGTLEQFKANTPELFTLKGDLRAEFKNAEEIIKAGESDPLFYKFVKGEGESQMIVNGEIGDIKWKGKLDRIHKNKAIVDLKVVASIRDKIWSESQKQKINFIDAYGYVDQAAVYRELYFQMTGEKLPFFIAALTKEDPSDKEIIHIPDEFMDNALLLIQEKVIYVSKIKSGELPPVKCGVCDYCRSVKKLENTISLLDLY